MENNYISHQGVPAAWIPLIPSLASSPYQLSLLVSPLDSIQCLHRADECKFLLVGITLMFQCIEIQRRIYLINSSLLLQGVMLVLLEWFMKITGCTRFSLSRICSKKLIFMQKIGSRSCNFCVYPCIYWLIFNILQMKIFDLQKKIWRIKIPNNLRNLFSSRT